MDMACPYSASFWHYTDFDNFCKGFCLEIFKFSIHIRKDLVFFMFVPPLSPGLVRGRASGRHSVNSTNLRPGFFPVLRKKTVFPRSFHIIWTRAGPKRFSSAQKKPDRAAAVTSCNIYYNERNPFARPRARPLTIIFKII